jgi:hypothetical protein
MSPVLDLIVKIDMALGRVQNCLRIFCAVVAYASILFLGAIVMGALR